MTTTKLRLSSEAKDVIAYRIASEWVDFARRILKESGKPERLSDSAARSVWVKLVARYGEELADTVSSRTIADIVKRVKHQARVMTEKRQPSGRAFGTHVFGTPGE